MKGSIIFEGRAYAAEPVDISIPLKFDGPQPNAFGVQRATAEACVAGEIVGDTRRGGSCNFEQITLIPHCNGTHTECVGHITHERIGVTSSLREAFTAARLISVEPVPESEEWIISRSVLEAALGDEPAGFDALIIRTLPNDESKIKRSYGEGPLPPHFAADAMDYIVAIGIKHLLVDLPSIDRLFDEGRLANHRIFWNVAEGEFAAGPGTRSDATITELIYVPEAAADGPYLLNLQIAPFVSDAAPSRPLIFAAAAR